MIKKKKFCRILSNVTQGKYDCSYVGRFDIICLYSCRAPQMDGCMGGWIDEWVDNSNRVDVMRAIVKVRILTGTYLLQVHRKKFRMDGVTDACCPLCYLEDEDIVHMLIRCPALNEVRITCINELKKCIQTWLGTGEWTRRIRNTNTLVQLIVDCRKLVPDVLPDTTEMLNVIESKSRLLCYKLHLKRLFLTNVNRDVSRVNMAPAPISNI